MNIVKAEWEKRNLGVETLEISFDEKDTIGDVTAVIKNPNAEYIVLKVPNTRTDIILTVQEYNYLFIEGMVHLVSRLSPVQLSSVEQRLYNSVEIELMNEDDIDFLKSQVRAGMFDSDRVFLDPFFNKKMAAERYVNWINDEIKRGTEYYKYIYREKSIGFFALREIQKGHYTSFLGGVYNEYRSSGLGAVVKGPEFVKSLGAKSIDSYVSTNNISQIRNLIRSGYELKEITYTFIKHI